MIQIYNGVVKDLQIMIWSNIGREVENREPNRTKSSGLVGIELFKMNYSSYRRMFIRINDVRSRDENMFIGVFDGNVLQLTDIN